MNLRPLGYEPTRDGPGCVFVSHEIRICAGQRRHHRPPCSPYPAASRQVTSRRDAKFDAKSPTATGGFGSTGNISATTTTHDIAPLTHAPTPMHRRPCGSYRTIDGFDAVRPIRPPAPTPRHRRSHTHSSNIRDHPIRLAPPIVDVTSRIGGLCPSHKPERKTVTAIHCCHLSGNTRSTSPARGGLSLGLSRRILKPLPPGPPDRRSFGFEHRG